MTTPLTRTVPAELAGLRLDQALTRLFPDHSRSRLKRWIEAGRVTVDGRQRRPRDRLAGGETVTLAPTEEAPRSEDRPQDIPLAIVHEDEELIVIDKPAGLVVHPAAGHHDGTLVNALLHHAPELARLPRAGIVHRLDKDTTGLMVVARTLRAHTALVAQLQARTVRRRYLALAQGWITAGGTIDAPIGRHPVDRKRFAVTPTGKEAITHYRVAERFPHHTLLRVHLETGRTHQIRVHMAHLRHPLVGDPQYGRLRLPPGAPEAVVQALRAFRRQALHAEKLTLIHPATGREVGWKAPLPQDFDHLLAALRRAYGTGPEDGDGWEVIWPQA